MVEILPIPGSNVPLVLWILISYVVLLVLTWCVILNVLLVYEFFKAYKSGSDSTGNLSRHGAQRRIHKAITSETSPNMLEYESGVIANKEHAQVVTITTTQVASSTKTVIPSNTNQNDQSKQLTGNENESCEVDQDKTNHSKDDEAIEQSHSIINEQQETNSDGSMRQELLVEQVTTTSKGHEVTGMEMVSHEVSKGDDEVGSPTLCPGLEEEITHGDNLWNGEVIDEVTLTADMISRAPSQHSSHEVCLSLEVNNNQQEREEIVVQAEVLPQKEYETVCIVQGTNPRMRELRMVASHLINIWELPSILAKPEYFEKEFEQLPRPSVDGKRLPQGIENKNRNVHILPAPHSIVRISNSSYINANFVRSFDGNKTTYIATQAPMKSTVEDFLHMILEYKCPVVIMNASDSKHNEEECCQYWSDYRSVTFGSVIVTTFDVVQCNGYTKRVMTVCIEEVGDLFKFTHYQLTSWHSNGGQGLMDSAILIDFLKKVDLRNNVNHPAIIHCPSGIDTTSIMIAIDQAIHYIDTNNKDNIDLMLIASHLRLDRPGSITTAQQYRYIYQVVHDYVFTHVYSVQEDV